MPRKILDNCKGFKIDIPVYSILTLLGEFGRWTQIGIFLGCKKVRFFFVKSFLLDPTKPLLPSTKCTQKCQKNITFERQAKRGKFPFLHTPYSCTQKCQKTTTFERYTKNESIDCYVSLPHFSFNPLQDSTSCRDSKSCTHRFNMSATACNENSNGLLSISGQQQSLLLFSREYILTFKCLQLGQ